MEDADNKIAPLIEAAATEDEESFHDVSQRHEHFQTLEQERRVLIENLLAAREGWTRTVLRGEMHARDWDECRRNAEPLEGDLQRLEKNPRVWPREAGMIAKEDRDFGGRRRNRPSTSRERSASRKNSAMD